MDFILRGKVEFFEIRVGKWFKEINGLERLDYVGRERGCKW